MTPKLGAVLLLSGLAAPAFGQSPAPARCSGAEHRQFDFWVGDWDVYEAVHPDSNVARARITRILNDCALREEYFGRNGLTGQSLSSYDANRRVWHQSWVTNRGQLLLIEGGLDGDRMLLSGPYPPGSTVLIRGTWKRVPEGVRETAETSEDGGKTWKPLFDLVFRKR